MHLSIVRHGECLGQCDPAFWTDPDSELSQLGKQQALLTGQKLAAVGVTHILSSPLIRALSTAAIIAKATGIEQITVWMALREGYSSIHRGFPRVELAQRYPQAILPDDIAVDGWAHGGDTLGPFLARSEAIVATLKATFQHDAHVVLVTHGGIANYLLHAILHIGPTTPQWFELANGSITRVRFVPNPAEERPNWPLYPPVDAEILSVNDIAHL